MQNFQLTSFHNFFLCHSNKSSSRNFLQKKSTKKYTNNLAYVQPSHCSNHTRNWKPVISFHVRPSDHAQGHSRPFSNCFRRRARANQATWIRHQFPVYRTRRGCRRRKKCLKKPGRSKIPNWIWLIRELRHSKRCPDCVSWIIMRLLRD